MEKNQVVQVLEGLLVGLKKEEGISSVISDEYRKELEEKKERLEKEIEVLREKIDAKKQELKTIESELNRDQSVQQKTIKQLATIADTLNINLQELGIEVKLPEVKKPASGTGRKPWSRESRFFVNGKPVYYKPEQNNISRVLYYATKNFGGDNENGSVSKPQFDRLLIEAGFDPASGDDYSVAVASKDGKKQVTIARVLQQVATE